MSTKRKDGLRQTCFRVNGKRYVVYGRNAKEIAEKKQKKIQEVLAGIERRKRPTLQQYFDSFAARRADKVTEATQRTQKMHFKAIAAVLVDGSGRRFGELKIDEITPRDCRKLQESLKGSTRTINDRISFLSFLLNEAVRDELIVRNPCQYIERIRRTEKPARETIHRALTKEETAKFFSAAAGNWYYNCFMLMIQAGLRIGESGALMASDIDTAAGCIHVSRTVTRDTAGGYVIGSGTKTAAGKRDIPINDAIRAAIRNQRQTMAAVGYLFRSDRLFVSTEGHILREDTINREIKRICSAAGVKPFTCHAFRATFATRFIEQRPQDYKALAEILGHSNTRITLDLYTHVMQETKAEAMKAIEIAM